MKMEHAATNQGPQEPPGAGGAGRTLSQSLGRKPAVRAGASGLQAVGEHISMLSRHPTWGNLLWQPQDTDAGSLDTDTAWEWWKGAWGVREGRGVAHGGPHSALE